MGIFDALFFAVMGLVGILLFGMLAYILAMAFGWGIVSLGLISFLGLWASIYLIGNGVKGFIK